MYMSSPSELTKFTISSAFCQMLAKMVGTVFTGSKELPEPPKQSFLKGLFGGMPSPLDRDELFSEASSGKPPKTTAKLILNSDRDLKTSAGGISSTNEFAKLREVSISFCGIQVEQPTSFGRVSTSVVKGWDSWKTKLAKCKAKPKRLAASLMRLCSNTETRNGISFEKLQIQWCFDSTSIVD